MNPNKSSRFPLLPLLARGKISAPSAVKFQVAPAFLFGLLLLGMLAVASGCSSNDSGADETSALNDPPASSAATTGETLDKDIDAEEELLRQEEEEALALKAVQDEEARAKEEEARIEQEKQYNATYAAMVLKEFGTQGNRFKPRSDVEITGIPFDQADPPIPRGPSLNIAIMSMTTQSEKAQQAALLIGTHQRDYLEQVIGREIKVVYVSHYEKEIQGNSLIQFRPQYVHAAMELAALLPNEQRLEPMQTSMAAQKDVHLLLILGKSYH